MQKRKKNIVNFTIKNEVSAEFKLLCEEKELIMSRVIQQFMEDFNDRFRNKVNKRITE